jgi:hypothetical protein
MKYLKAFFILILIWPKLWYTRIAWKAEEEWRAGGEIPPQYSEETKKLIKKQKRAKTWALIMSLIPLGPISLFMTWLSFRFENTKTIEYLVSQQNLEIEEIKELKRQRKETFIKYLEERLRLEEEGIDWENMNLPSSEQEQQLREFLFGKNGVLTKGPEKDNVKTKKDEELEELNI